MYFLAKNFEEFCIMETIGLLFILIKVIDGLRIIDRINVIMLTLIHSKDNMLMFIFVYMFFHFAFVPFA